MDYYKVLSKDKKLKKIIDQQEFLELKQRKDLFLHLVESIISQQLSVKAAQVIYNRFLALFDHKNPSPEQVLLIKPDVLRAIGLSNSKTSYVHHVARFAIEPGMEYRKLKKMSDDEVIEYLTQIKGVGRWTVEMQLMFTLGREDIFPVADIGIQNAMVELYRPRFETPKELQNKLLSISEKWIPYRTYACLHLWRWKDSK